MSFLHGRCESIEQLLRGRCSDLEQEVDRLREQQAGSLERERELMNQLVALTNPGALRVLAAVNRPTEPAAPRPPARPRGVPLPGQHQARPPQLARTGPVHSPDAAGFQPVRQPPEEKKVPAEERRNDASLPIPARSAALRELQAVAAANRQQAEE